MTALDRALPAPSLREVDHVDLALPIEEAWHVVRHGDLGRDSALVRALFAIRTLPSRLAGKQAGPAVLGIDELRSTHLRPGFTVLVDDPPREIVVGAIGKVWRLAIPFVHLESADEMASFCAPDFVKVAWAIRLSPIGERGTRVELELRVDATDDDAWRKFRRYFRIVGPGSRFIRRSILQGLARTYGTPASKEDERPLPGDELLPDAAGSLTHAITIAAPPQAIWPWLVQMGCDRAGYYSLDVLDNGGVRSARELHPELQDVRVGDVLPARPGSKDGFEVLRVDPNRTLILGGLWDPDAGTQLAFEALRPARYWHVTWAFHLEPLDERTTRLHVRARAAFSARQRLHAAWIRPAHALMETTQLRNLKRRVEGKLPRDDARDVLDGVAGAGRMVLAMITPFRRDARSHWGIDEEVANRTFPGDELVSNPRWSWTHGIEIDAPASEVWAFVSQIGATKGGFYSYQWLENLVGCNLRNTEIVHPEWEAKVGDALVLHPRMPALPIVAAERGKWFVAHAAPDAKDKWVAASWLFHVEPIGDQRSRFISRYRAATSDDLATRLSFGPSLVEPIGFAMDRRMLLGVRSRAEAHSSRSNIASISP